MLSTLPMMALLLVQYSMVTIEAPVQTLGGASTPIQSSADLEGQIGDLTLPASESSNATKTTTRTSRSAPDYATFLNDIGDFRLPGNITAGHLAKAAK